MRYDGKVAFVTGAAGNLGRAVATAFHDRGASVVAVDLDAAALRSVYGEPDARTLVAAANALDSGSIDAAVADAGSRFGGIDILCNIAGGFASGPPVHQTLPELWRRMFDLNVTTATNCIRAVVPSMIDRGGGSVVNVAAASSIRGQPNMAAYVVAKNAIVRLTESMAAELRANGICVACVMPTIIDTPQNRAAMPSADTSQWTPPEAIAEVVLWLASDDAMVASGCAIPISGRPRS